MDNSNSWENGHLNNDSEISLYNLLFILQWKVDTRDMETNKDFSADLFG